MLRLWEALNSLAGDALLTIGTHRLGEVVLDVRHESVFVGVIKASLGGNLVATHKVRGLIEDILPLDGFNL